MEDIVRRLERLQQGELEEEEKSRWLTRRKQQIWDDQYQQPHNNLADLKERYKASFILQEILGPRPETPLLDNIATPEQLKKLEEERKEKDDILEDWHTPPGLPWERNPDQTFDMTSLSWDTYDVNIPDSWNERRRSRRPTPRLRRRNVRQRKVRPRTWNQRTVCPN